MFSEAFGKLLIDIKNLFTVYRRSLTVVMSSTEKSSCPIRVKVINLLEQLQRERGLTYLFIA